MKSDIRSRRIELNLKLKELSTSTGIPLSRLAKIERVLVRPTEAEWKAIAECLGCSYTTLRQGHLKFAKRIAPGEGYTTAVANDTVIYERKSELTSLPKVLDLFCGAGGLSFGFEQTGFFQVTAGIDLLRDRIDTFRLNHERAVAICADLRTFSLAELSKRALHPQVIVAGPPCQGFSSIRPFRTLTEGDHRNSLIETYLLCVEALRPEWCVFENVVGLLTHQNGEVLRSMLQGFQDIGYHPEWRVLNAANYGVPQNRERIVIIANKSSTKKFQWPKPTHFSNHRSMAGRHAPAVTNLTLFNDSLPPALTVMDAIYDLPEVGAGELKEYYNHNVSQNEYVRSMRRDCEKLTLHEATAHSEKMMRIIRYAGRNRFNGPHRLTTSGFSSSYSRLDGDRPSVTLTVNFVHPASNKCIHPKQNRALTPREGARLQSFPDSYKFAGTRAQIVKQIGNSVPPLLAKEIGNSIAIAMGVGISNRLELDETTLLGEITAVCPS